MAKLYQRRKDPITGSYGELVKVIGNTEIYRADDGTFFKRVAGKPSRQAMASKGQRSVGVEPYTPWGAPIGGAINPIALELAERVKKARGM